MLIFRWQSSAEEGDKRQTRVLPQFRPSVILPSNWCSFLRTISAQFLWSCSGCDLCKCNAWFRDNCCWVLRWLMVGDKRCNLFLVLLEACWIVFCWLLTMLTVTFEQCASLSLFIAWPLRLFFIISFYFILASSLSSSFTNSPLFFFSFQSFFGRTYNNLNALGECKNNGECVINKKNRTSCKSCRLKKCLMVGMSKSGKCLFLFDLISLFSNV